MYWGVIMDVALITVIGVAIGSIVSVIRETKAIKDTKETLSKEHKVIEDKLLKEHQNTFTKVDSINTTMIEEKERREKLYNTYTPSQKELNIHLEGLTSMWEVINNLKEENINLKSTNEKSNKMIEELNQRIEELESYKEEDLDKSLKENKGNIANNIEVAKRKAETEINTKSETINKEHERL